MPTRHPREPLVVLAAVAVTVTAVLIAVGGRGGGARAGGEPTWRGLAGAQRVRVAVGQRVIVVLKAPALADRVGSVGGLATDEEERQWTQAALSSQRLLIARLRVQGVLAQPEFTYTRTLNGFSAAFDARGIALLERAPEVAGIYPVRVAYPASVSSSSQAAASGERPDVTLADKDGRGVTIALLDTGVDRKHPFLNGRVDTGIDIVGGDPNAKAAPNPDEPSQLEEHGTAMAGLVVGSGGPKELRGVAPGATVLPIRVAGWQRDASAHWAVYGRTDQVLAGLERAVDPNADGDAHDAARVALIGVAEPFASFADGPLARAVTGARRLDTLVVAPAGNDGSAGPGFGSVAGPGGAADALTVGAIDLRRRFGEVHVVVRSALRVELDELRPLAGAVRPSHPLDVGVGAPRAQTTASGSDQGSVPLLDFFDRKGQSLVAGGAALVRAGSDPVATVAHAAQAGAVAALLYGSTLPAGGIGLGESDTIPAASIPEDVARRLLAHLRDGVPVTASLGSGGTTTNTTRGRVAAFSSTGLAFDGRVKPDLVAPGVALETSQPGRAPDGSARYGTVNGTSGAAAVVAGAAALLAQARPDLDAQAIASLLAGSARPLPDDRLPAQGAGLLDVGGAAATEIAAVPRTLALGDADARAERIEEDVDVRNVSARRMVVSVQANVSQEGAAAVRFGFRPRVLSLAAGASRRVHVTATVVSNPQGFAPAEGTLLLTPLAGRQVRVPWVILFGRGASPTLASVHLSSRSFSPSDVTPSLLTFVAGSVPRAEGESDVRPVSRLDLELWSPNGGRIGLLARLRDVLPGRYSFGVTGRDPTGAVLAPGDYELRLIAHGTERGPSTTRIVHMTIK